MGKSGVLWVIQAEPIGETELAKAGEGEKINVGVEDNMSGDLQVQESKGACSLFGPPGG